MEQKYIKGDIVMYDNRIHTIEGSNGWELVQWDVIQERLNESSLFQNTMSTTGIVATWKREVNN